jgi:Ran GTPase-activating protein (RanGAP) involved in mRNA processing and transport
VQAARGGILDLADIHLGASDAVELCQLVRQKPTIQSIVLHANELGDAGASAIAPLISTGSLKSLNLYGNAIGHAGAQSICSALQSNTSTLHALSLQLNPLGLEACKYLASSITSTSSLRVLNLGACLLGDAGCQALFASPVLLQTLHALHLESNDLTSACAVHIGKALQSAGRSCSLQRLFLSDNPRLGIDPTGMQALAAGLSSATSLAAIELESCGIESEGATALFRAALPLPSEHTSTLQVLVLAHNPIGDAALLECARRLRQLARPDSVESTAPTSSALAWRDLADTGLTDKSAVAIADAIRGNPNALRILFLGYSFAVRLSASASSSLAKVLHIFSFTPSL